MKKNFMCPYCRGFINAGENVIFSAKTEHERLGLLFLSNKLGDYKIDKHTPFQLAPGEVITLYCPICHANLIDRKRDKHLARILMIDEDHEEHEIVFSGIVGEYCTYKLSDNKIEKFGEDAEMYKVGISYVNLIDFK